MAETDTGSYLDDFAQKSSEFVKWFNAFEGSRLSTKIQLTDLRSRNAGRGVLAIEDIPEDEELFAIPKRLALLPDTSGISKDILQNIDDSDSWSLLIITLIYEILQKETSPWYPYLQVLPTEFDTLMFWSDTELKHLQGSTVVQKIGKEEAESSWKKTLIPIMLQNSDSFPVPGTSEQARTEQLIQLAHKAGSLIMAYAFDVDRDNDAGTSNSLEEDDLAEDDEDNPLKAMVPFADMLNADAERNNARLFQEEDYLVMRSIKPIKAGEEVFNDYGPLPRSDLLRMYGYVTDNYAKYDVIEIPLEMAADVASKLTTLDKAAWEERLEQLERQDFFDDGYVLPRPKGNESLEAAVPEDLRATIHVFCSDKDPFNRTKGPISVKEASLLAAILETRLKDYATSVQDDNTLLQGLQFRSTNMRPEDLTNRIEMAVKVRKGEKEICEAIIRHCTDYIQSMSRAANDTNKRHHDNALARADNRQSSKRPRKAVEGMG